MQLQNISINKSINKAYLKLQPTRSQIETFKENFIYLFKQIKESEGEEFHKNEISEFLKKTYYAPDHYVNTKGRYDLVIHNGKESNTSVGVIVETKSPGNAAEMPTVSNINSKAVRELILYYLRERVTNKNLELKHLIATNLFEWFIFDAHDFEKLFAENKSLVKQFTDFEEGRLSGKDTSFFYNSVAAPFLESLDTEIRFTHFDLRDYEKIIKNSDPVDDIKLIPLYKILSPEHLLKLQFKNDSNSLDKDFYRELLHIIGLEETKEGSKKIIGRAGEKTRNYGSLLESTISIIHSEDLLSQVSKPTDFGETRSEQLFNISLELVITWINRILFLKLLEGQLVRYNKGDKNFMFLDQSIIPDYDALNKLFFQVLAIPEGERDQRIKEKFENIPYLNSSLFEATDLERRTIRISNLDDENRLPIHKSTVLKDNLGKRISGERPTLIYLFEFLDAYNFSSDGGKGIQEENKTLINASVLGLIFEKINGYKDGSFFTPGFITQYMCHETITRAVVQKFNEAKGWSCENLIDVNNKIDDKKEANKIINSLRICDPAVGSGHFLVSALNEIISIKSELKILMDSKGKVLRDYQFEVINDELIVSDEEGEPFEYNPRNPESQRVQETIFHEKQTIIENCLFGVDINPNSVKICRLRLWIELLKNAYYKPGEKHRELETLPNIDINIKCGNSLISRYPLDADIRTALKSSKWTVDNYREAVMLYRNAESKEQKREMEKLITEIKSNFESEISKGDKRFLKLNKISGELLSMTTQQGLFELGKKEKEEWNKKVNKLADEQKALEQQLGEIRNNKIYENAFEWRFEFPEVLNSGGEFVGFDVIIGNPPYIRVQDLPHSIIDYYKSTFFSAYKRLDISILFSELGLNILSNNSYLSFITSNQFFKAEYGRNARELLSKTILVNIDFSRAIVFDGLATYVSVLLLRKGTVNRDGVDFKTIIEPARSHETQKLYHFSRKLLSIDPWEFNSHQSLKEKIYSSTIPLKSIANLTYGLITGYDDAFIFDTKQFDSTIFKQPYFYKFIRPQNYKRYIVPDSNQYVFYPYDEDGNVISEDILRKNTLFYDYLCSKKTILMNRKDSRASVSSKGLVWYSLIRKIDLNETKKKKIVFYDVGSEPNFSIDTEGSLFGGGTTHSLSIINIKNYSIESLLGLLNSKLLSWIIKDICPIKMGDARKFGLAYIERLPIRELNQNYQDQIGSLVTEILNNPSDMEQISDEIDNLVYRLYQLTPEEIEIINNDIT